MNARGLWDRKIGWLLCASLAVGVGAGAAPVTRQIAREENRSQEIGDQTQKIADELDAIIRQLENNRLMTGDESADFLAARNGMEEIAEDEVGAVVSKLVEARQAVERLQRRQHLTDTLGAQDHLISRLTEELIRIQYRSQLRNLLEQMRAIVDNQRDAIRTTQNGAIEIAGSDSDPQRREVHDRLIQTQDAVWHDWVLVREEVRIMVERYSALPFTDTLKLFRARASELPVESKLAETRNSLRGSRFGLAVSGQRELSVHFLELLKILQTVGLSPSEQRSALDDLIDKTEQALRDQQELQSRTETIGRDLTEPLREELAGAEDRLGDFVQDLAQEADQVLGKQNPTAEDENPPAGGEPGEAGQAEQKQPEKENPWDESKAEPVEEESFKPATEAAQDLTEAADSMTQAADELNQGNIDPATNAQRQAVNELAQALARMREQLDNAQRDELLEQLAELLSEQNEILNELSNIIRDQEGLMAQTQTAARADSAPPQSPAASDEGQPPEGAAPANDPARNDAAQPSPGEQGDAAPQPAEGAPESPSPAQAPPTTELATEQQGLGDRTEAFSRKMPLSPAAPALADAIGSMDQAASQLQHEDAHAALPPQRDALKSLRDAERQIAEAMAEALGATEPLEWLDQMEGLDGMIGQIEQMAAEAAAMMPAPAPDMAMQAGEIANELGMMAGMPPMGPSMAAQMREGGQMMNMASGQLNQGQTGQASQTMSQAAAGLKGLRGQMAGEMSAGLQQAMAQAAQAAGQAMSGQQLAAAAQQGMQPSSQPGRGGRGQGMRGLGPTNTDPNREIAVDLESGAWSLLPEREREEILQSLKERYPARYERALVRYYRNLSRLEAEP